VPNLTNLTILASVLVILLAGSAGAQVPAADGCTLPPLELPLFAATPAAAVTPPPFTPVVAGDVDAQDVEQAVTTILACIGTGDAALVYAVFTEAYLARAFADPTETYLPQLEQAIAEGSTEAGTTFELLDVLEFSVRDDGRVSVTIAYTNGISEFKDTLILAQVDGVWLIDDIGTLEPPA
jgi:hypothetical protein